MRSVEEIRAEIVAAVGFVPPAFDGVRDDPAMLEALWQVARAGYACNPLPSPFKEKFLLLMARTHRTTSSLIIRCCHLYDRGVPAAEILDLSRATMPRVPKLLEDIAAVAARGGKDADWTRPGSAMERLVLWLGVRVARHRDRRGRCCEALRMVMGDRLADYLILLGAFAAHERVWNQSRSSVPTADAPGYEPYLRDRTRLLTEVPEIEKVWQRHEARRRRRRVGRRERDLLSELASQDRIRAAVQASEKRFRAVVQSSPLPMMVYAEDGQVIHLNNAWSETSGWDPADIQTLGEWRFCAEDDEARAVPVGDSEVHREVDALYESDEPIEEGEIAIRTRHNGQLIWEMTSVAIGKLPDGRRGVLRIGRDVTTRREMEQALWQANRKMTTILQSISDGFVSLDLQWRFIFVNDEAERIMGQTRAQLVGAPIYQFPPWAREGALFRKVEAAASEGIVLHDEYLSAHAGRWIHYHAYPSEEGVSLFFEDVTEEKRMQEALAESEQRLRQIATTIRDIVWVTDIATRQVLYISPAYEEIWGRTAQELQGDPVAWFDSVHQADRAVALAGFERQFTGQESEYEFRVVRPDGAIRWVRARVIPFKDAQGVAYRVVGTCQDITAQREAEAAMRANDRPTES